LLSSSEGVERAKQVAMLSLHKATFSIDESWSAVLEMDLSKPKSEGGGTLSDMKDQFQNILEVLRSNEEDLDQSFGQIGESIQHIVNTMVKVLKDAITKNAADSESAKVKLLTFTYLLLV
jgi:hypothetical protein